MAIRNPELFDLTHDFIVEIDGAGIIRDANDPICKALALARPDIVGRPFIDLVAIDSRDECIACLDTTASAVPVHGSNLTLLTDSGQPIRVEASFHPKESEGAISIFVFLRSLTEQQQVRQALRESERQLRRVLTALPDVLLVIDASGRYRQIYTAEVELLAGVPDAMLGQRIVDISPPNEAAEGMQVIQEVIESQRPINTEYSIRVQGEAKWFSARVVPFGTANDPCVLWVARDITSLVDARRKLQEDEKLLRSLLELETKAREVIAYEIHDGFVQYAVGTQMWLQNVVENLDELPAETAMAITVSVESINQAVEDARTMIRDLRPVVIGEAGIDNGLRELIDVMVKKTDIPIEFECEIKPPKLLPLLEGQVLRIVQESLNNVIRHSKATRSSVRLAGDEATLEVCIIDNGLGFDPSQVASDRYGLEGIQQRANVFGGGAQVVTRLGAGTTVRVRLPIIRPES